MENMEKIVKQSHLLHTFLLEFIKEDLEFTAKWISKEFKMPISEVKINITPLIRMFFIHLYSELILKKRKDKKLFHEFLLRIGKTDVQIKELYNIFGSYNEKKDFFGEIQIESEYNFCLQLQSELEIHELNEKQQTIFHIIYLKIFTSCESIIQNIDQTSEQTVIKNGKFDYK